MQIAVGEHALCQRAEADDALLQPCRRFLKSVVLDGAVKNGIAILVDNKRAVQLTQNAARLFELFAVIIGKSHIQRLTACHRLCKRPHRFFERRFRIGTMVIEDVHIGKSHAAQAGIQTCQQIFAAAPIPIRAVPHGIARLCADDQLVAVRQEIVAQQLAEVFLGTARCGTVVVCKIKVRDTVVKRSAAQ